MLPGRAIVGGGIVLAGIVLASGAEAQCAGGRIAIVDGACCWPDQSWTGERCAGPPACPHPLVADGDSCVPRMLPVVVVPPSSVAPPAAAVPTSPTEPPVAPIAEAPTILSIRHQLVGLGATHLAIGWTGAAVVGTIYSAAFSSFGPSCRSSFGAVGWIPVIGAPIAAAAIHACNPPWESPLIDWAMFGASFALQAIGLVMIIVGWLDRRPVPRPVELGGGGVVIRF